MGRIKLFDTEKGYRFMIPHFKRLGIPSNEIDVIRGDSLTALLKLMTATEQAYKPNDIDNYLKLQMFGPPGSGKSYTAVLIAVGLYKLTSAPILIIDSGTNIWYNYIRDYQSKKGLKQMTRNHWMRAIPLFRDEYNSRIKNSNLNIIVTGRVGQVFEEVKDDHGNVVDIVAVDTKMKMEGESAYEPDVVVEMELIKSRDDENVNIKQRAVVLKDRSDTIEGKSFISPTWENFKPVWDFMSDEVPESPQIDPVRDNVLFDDEEDNYKAQEAKQIILEKIAGVFALTGLGTGAADKKRKTDITQRIFMTTSGKEIENMSIDQLSDALSRLENDREIAELITGKKL